MIREGERVVLLFLEILQIFFGVELREGIETLRTIFRIPYKCVIFYCFNLFILLFQGKL